MSAPQPRGKSHILEIALEMLKAAVLKSESGVLTIPVEDVKRVTMGFDLVVRRERGGSEYHLRLKEMDPNDAGQGNKVIMPGANDVPEQFRPDR